MKLSGLRLRFWVEVVLFALGVGLLALTLVNPEWIEEIFHIEPDEGSGTLELGISVALILVAVASALLARSEWRLAAARR